MPYAKHVCTGVNMLSLMNLEVLTPCFIVCAYAFDLSLQHTFNEVDAMLLLKNKVLFSILPQMPKPEHRFIVLDHWCPTSRLGPCILYVCF